MSMLQITEPKTLWIQYELTQINSMVLSKVNFNFILKQNELKYHNLNIFSDCFYPFYGSKRGKDVPFWDVQFSSSTSLVDLKETKLNISCNLLWFDLNAEHIYIS